MACRRDLASRHIETGVIHRPRCLAGAGSAVTFLPLTHVRERSAERRLVSPWHQAVPRAGRPARTPPGAPPRRFWAQSPYFFVGPEGFSPLNVIQAALALPFIRRCPATQGGPLIGGGR